MNSKQCLLAFVGLLSLAIIWNIILGVVYGFPAKVSFESYVFSGLLVFTGVCFWVIALIKILKGGK